MSQTVRETERKERQREHRGETEAGKRRHKRLKRGWLLKEENQVNNKMKVRDNKEVTGGEMETKRVSAMDNICAFAGCLHLSKGQSLTL